jgi:hypothetical protein
MKEGFRLLLANGSRIGVRLQIIAELDRVQNETRSRDPVRLRPHPYEFELYYDI